MFLGLRTNFHYSLSDEINHFTDAHEDADHRRDHHKLHKDLLLRWPGNETIHRIRTRVQRALNKAGKVVAFIYVMKNIEKCDIYQYFDDQAQKVGPPKTPTFFPWVGIQVGALVVGRIFFVLFLSVFDVGYDQERRARDEDELQCPQTDVRYGEGMVITDIIAAWLLGVAHKFFALVAPNALGRHHEHHHAKHEHHGQPHAAKHCGVFIDPAD